MHESSVRMRILNHAGTHGGPRSNSGISAPKLAVKIALFVFWALFGTFNMYLIWLSFLSHRRRMKRLRAEAENQTQARVIATRLAGMTIDAKILYYNMLFVRQGNHMKLTKDQIYVVNDTMNGPNSANNSEITRGNFAEDDIEKGGTMVTSVVADTIDMEDGSTSVQLSPMTVHDCEQPATCGSSDELGEKTLSTLKNKIDGQCAICLEMYQVGDTIVYNINTCRKNSRSKTKSSQDSTAEQKQGGSGCYHVYHKDCLVQYLSKRQISEQGLIDGEADAPQCPTCRDSYCELIPIDADCMLKIAMDEETSITHVDESSSLRL